MALDILAIQQLLEKEIKALKISKQPSELYDPIAYILALGGKRLRPALTLIAYQLFKNDYEKAIPAALAVEIFHNFSLVHDDIMDEAPLGQETVHKKWNQNIAILSGDVMLVQAYQQLLKLPQDGTLTILDKFSICATEVCEGQQFDMDFENIETVEEDEYINMIRLKTAVLLGYSLQSGALVAGSSSEDADLLRQFGTAIGIGFQLKDDLLDVFGDAAKVGKQVGGDIISNKKTYLLIQALNLASSAQKAILNEWIAKKEFDPKEKVAAVTAIYNELNIAQLTETKMNEQFNLGFEFLKAVNCDEDKKQELIDFSYNLIHREK